MDRSMSLSPPVPRDPIHVRRIDCRGYRRSDGLWDIEGHSTDTKSYGFVNSFRGEIAPGEPIHDMWLRLTLENEPTVIRAEAVTAAGPFAICPAITPAFIRLEGLKIGPGWRRTVQARLGGVQGCTHLVELLGPLATTAYQTIHAWRARHEPQVATDRPPSLLDSCHALARDGEVVRTHFPRWYTAPEPEPGA
jgi:hypothetical protein